MKKLRKYRWELVKMFGPDKMIAIKPTMKCNLSCEYCGAVDKDKGRMPKYKEQSVQDWIKLINKESPSLVVISGGEPTLYKGLSEIINYCIDNKILVQVITNLTNKKELLETKKSWRVILLSSYHESGSLSRFLDTYKTLKDKFYITVRELRPADDMKPKYIPWAKVHEIFDDLPYIERDMYAPDGTYYDACVAMVKGGK